MAEEIITITKKEYDRLVKREYWLQCLETMGVDNWPGYGEAAILRGENENDKS